MPVVHFQFIRTLNMVKSEGKTHAANNVGKEGNNIIIIEYFLV